MDFDNDITFEGENFRDTKTYSYKEIVLAQVQRVVGIASKEMREGFYIYSQNANQQAQKMRYVGDTREEYWNSVDVLHDLLLAKFDDEMKKQSAEIYNLVDELKEEFLQEVQKTEDTRKLHRTYISNKLKLYRKLFQQLCLFLNRENFLETEEIHD